MGEGGGGRKEKEQTPQIKSKHHSRPPPPPPPPFPSTRIPGVSRHPALLQSPLIRQECPKSVGTDQSSNKHSFTPTHEQQTNLCHQSKRERRSVLTVSVTFGGGGGGGGGGEGLTRANKFSSKQ